MSFRLDPFGRYTQPMSSPALDLAPRPQWQTQATPASSQTATPAANPPAQPATQPPNTPADLLNAGSSLKTGQEVRSANAQRRVAGKRHLVVGREDAEACGGAVGLVGKEEGDLGQIELASDRLHGGVVQAAPVFEDGELVAAEGRFGKDVEQAEGVARHGKVRWVKERVRRCVIFDAT